MTAKKLRRSRYTEGEYIHLQTANVQRRSDKKDGTEDHAPQVDDRNHREKRE